MVIEAGAPVLRFESEAEWHDRARGQQRRLATLDAPGALTMVGDAVAPGRGQGLGVLVLRFEPARALESRLSPASAASLAVDLAGLVETHRRAGGTDVLGPYDPALVVQTDAGLRVVAPGFARLVQRHDAGIRGIFDGARVAHVRMTRDEARATPGLPHQVTCLALLVLELVAGREPYPLTSEVDYLGAVVAGAREPIDGFVPQLTAPLRRTIEQALLRDPAARPSLTELREALLAEPGVAELRARAATIQ